MKKTRFLSILLAILMLLGSVATFASCGVEDGVVEVSDDTLTLDLSAFSVYYGEELAKDEVICDMANEVAALLSQGTGKTAKAYAFSKVEDKEAGLEVLIGQTTREESVDALESIAGNGFSICVSESKVVILGTTKLLTVQALQYFLNNYLRKAESMEKVELPEEICTNKVQSVLLAKDDQCDVTFVYGAELNDSRTYNGGAIGVSNEDMDNRDYPFAVVEKLLEEISENVKLGKKRDSLMQKDSAPATEKEFMVGIVERDPVRSCLSELNGGEYCFRVENGQFILTAWNETALAVAYEQVKDLLSIATETVDGVKTIAFPEGFELRGSGNNAWRTDCPLPDGLQLENTLDTADDSLQYLYLGEGVGPDAFRAYEDKLKGEGYTLLTENEIEQSLFATYVNKETGLMIYVAYNAYAHQEEYGHAYEKALRVVVMPTDSVVVPDASLFSATSSYAKVTDSAITAVALDKGYAGMCYVLTLEDGRFVIFDGGKKGDGNLMTDRLWDVLTALHTQIYGKAPDKQDPIRVAAWVITHSHSDHYNVPREFMKKYCQNGKIKIEYLVGNFPSKSAVWPVYNADIGQMSVVGAVQEMQGYADFTFLKVQTGQKLYLANLELEVMTTYDALNPSRIRVQNDTCTVLRCSFKKAGAEDYTMMWLGDANRDQSRLMCAMYGDYMGSDLVQVAHHGGPGCENDMYNTVNASVVMFPNTLERYQTYTDATKVKPGNRYDVNRTLIFENENTEYVFISHQYHTTLVMGEDNKPMFDKIYDALKGPEALIDYTSDAENGGTAIKIKD